MSDVGAGGSSAIARAANQQLVTDIEAARERRGRVWRTKFLITWAVVVPTASTVQTIAELDGKSICVGTATTYEQWLNGTLEIVDPNIQTPPANAEITALPTDNECIQAVQAGRTYDAIVGNANSNADAIAKGAPLRVLEGPPIFSVSVAFALDKSGPNTTALKAILDQIVTEMHEDGTLKGFSEEWLKQDVTTKPE